MSLWSQMLTDPDTGRRRQMADHLIVRARTIVQSFQWKGLEVRGTTQTTQHQTSLTQLTRNLSFQTSFDAKYSGSVRTYSYALKRVH